MIHSPQKNQMNRQEKLNAGRLESIHPVGENGLIGKPMNIPGVPGVLASWRFIYGFQVTEYLPGYRS